MLATVQSFLTPGGMKLVADVVGHHDAPPVVFLHGGGQTRNSWKRSLRTVAEAGFLAYALDARGHGESDYAPDGDYRFETMAKDVAHVLTQIGPRPALVGASLGGITSLLLVGEALAADVRALVLVDIAPRVNPAGLQRILAFMSAHPDGFATIEDAVDAVARYNPNRATPPDPDGMRRNLRERDGRLFWHWDPRFVTNRMADRAAFEPRLDAAASRVTIPTALIHAGRSDLIGEAEVAHFRRNIPHLHYAKVNDAGHMVVGDRNDAFNATILAFLNGAKS